MEKILVGYPFYPGSVLPESLLSAAMQATTGERFEMDLLPHGSGATARGFNALWAAALGRGMRGEITHFAMLHADIVPEPGWLDILFDESQRLCAEMVSAVVPIKDDRGLTSTGVDWEPGDPYHVRRFSMTEISGLPENFSTADLIEKGLSPHGLPLLVNTGCWICDMRRPAWYEQNGRGEAFFYFTLNDRIRFLPDGSGAAVDTESEDWWFSRKMAARNMRYYATRKVRLKHVGPWPYTNQGDWGRWKTDEARGGEQAVRVQV